MSLINLATAGFNAALERFKIAFPAPTDPTVKSSPLLSAAAPTTGARVNTPQLDPATLAQTFNVHEQGRTRLEPPKKVAEVSPEDTRLCTSCRKGRHYGPCGKALSRTAETPHGKLADFNLGMTSDDAPSSQVPSTSPGYHSATSADSSLARARNTRPAIEQANTAFADLFRHLGIESLADQPNHMTGELLKQSSPVDWGTLAHSRTENRGPTTTTLQSPLTPARAQLPGTGTEQEQTVSRMFDTLDRHTESTPLV